MHYTVIFMVANAYPLNIILAPAMPAYPGTRDKTWHACHNLSN
jgi:hypothetical protein